MMTYKEALERNESKAGLDISELALDDLLTIMEELPGWDYPLAEDLLRDFSRRAGIDYDAFFSEREPWDSADCNDLWAAAAEKLGVN